MTFTYTSADLSEIAASLPERAVANGLPIFPDVDISRDADVQLYGAMTSIEDALRLASAVKAPFITIEDSFYEVEGMRGLYTEEHGELPSSAAKLIDAATEHNGSMISLKVIWVADGLVYQWSAPCEWINPLLSKLEAALAEAEADVEAVEEAEREIARDEYATAFQAAVTTLVESPRFRAEQPNKRSLIAPAILAAAGTEEPDPVYMKLRVMPEANKIVKSKAQEYEYEFSARISELGDELRQYPAWQEVSTKIKRTAAAVKFLMEKADGYRLSNTLAEDVSDAAAKSQYYNRYSR